MGCFISVRLCSAPRASWVWDCWPAELSVLPSSYRERASESRGQDTERHRAIGHPASLGCSADALTDRWEKTNCHCLTQVVIEVKTCRMNWERIRYSFTPAFPPSTPSSPLNRAPVISLLYEPSISSSTTITGRSYSFLSVLPEAGPPPCTPPLTSIGFIFIFKFCDICWLKAQPSAPGLNRPTVSCTVQWM